LTSKIHAVVDTNAMPDGVENSLESTKPANR
jgi:hypothetical protein